jgi:hypothetical protein
MIEYLQLDKPTAIFLSGESPMSEAFDWLEANLDDPATIDAPDSAIDYIFMVDDEEWPTLLRLWDERSVHWREGLAYLISFQSADIALPFLRKAIFDSNEDVAIQGLLSLSDLIFEYGEHFQLSPDEAEQARKVSRLEGARPFGDFEDFFKTVAQ